MSAPAGLVFSVMSREGIKVGHKCDGYTGGTIHTALCVKHADNPGKLLPAVLHYRGQTFHMASDDGRVAVFTTQPRLRPLIAGFLDRCREVALSGY